MACTITGEVFALEDNRPVMTPFRHIAEYRIRYHGGGLYSWSCA
jgi:hypothetical protein